MTSYQQQLDGVWSPDGIYVRTQAEQMVISSRERSAIDVDEYARKAIDYSKSSAEISRKNAVDRRIKILKDAWGPILKAAIEDWLRPEIQDLVMGEKRSQLDLSRNPAKQIWKELSVLYKLPPKRTTPADESDVEKYTELLRGTNFHGACQMAELLLNACNEVVIWPDVIKYNGKKIIRHRVAAGNTITAIPMAEDQSLVECYVHTYEYVDLFAGKQVLYVVWTGDWHVTYRDDDSGELERVGYIDPDLHESSVDNPYGELPHVHVRLVNWPDGPWDITSGEDLADLTIHGGKDRAFYRYLQKVSGFKQAIFSGNFDKVPQTLLDPGYAIKLEGDAINATIVDWSVPLRERLQCMMDDELSAAASRGINPQRYRQTGDYQTANSAAQADRGLDEARHQRAPILEDFEKRYKRKLCIVAAKHGLENVPDPEVELEVTYQPIDYPEDPRAQAELDKLEISLGVKSQLDIVRRNHPDWDDDQCKQYIIDTLDVISWIAEEKTKRNVADDPTVQTASAESNGALGPKIRDGIIAKDSQPVTDPANQNSIGS